jgi:hypothetical protein
MSTQSNTLLKLVPVDSVNQADTPSSNARSVDGGPWSPSVPSPSEMTNWRVEADARLEDALSQFDMHIIGGEDPARAAHRLVHEFMEWSRASLERFKKRPLTKEQRMEWSRECAIWTGLADLSAQDAPRDPSCVDRFLQIWLGVVHEASATGRSWAFTR